MMPQLVYGGHISPLTDITLNSPGEGGFESPWQSKTAIAGAVFSPETTRIFLG
jgi:hypothetical protein